MTKLKANEWMALVAGILFLLFEAYFLVVPALHLANPTK